MNKAMYWLLIVAMVVGLYFTTWVNYLLFHSLVELFSVIVAASVFIITWKSIRYIKNPYLIMVGTASFFIGILDLLHTLAFKGMPIFTDYDYYANQLWIAARSLESTTLLAAFLLLYRQKRVRSSLLFVGYFAVTALLILSIFVWKTFPICFVEGVGQTPFKIYSEYVICGVLACSLTMLVKSRSHFSSTVYRLLLLSILYTIVSELAFTVYIDNYDISNLIGHYFKLFSFMTIFQAIVSTGIEEPYRLIFNDLSQANIALQEEIRLRKESQEALQRLNEVLDRRVAERTLELREKDHLLMQQGRLAAMGEMINNIAHQWRQPLNALGLLIQETALLFELGELNRDSIAKSSSKSMALIKHMSQTIEEFRNFFKPDKEKVHFSITDEVKKTLSLIEGSLQGQRIAIEVVADGDPSVLGFPNQFSHVLLNILINARDAFAERNVADPRVVITVRHEEERALVTIADNAGGVPEEIMEKIFSPYFTTKAPDTGTGVGLFMSKKIIEKNMGGFLSVRNIDGGAEFRIVI